jgi:hypothetical protein
VWREWVTQKRAELCGILLSNPRLAGVMCVLPDAPRSGWKTRPSRPIGLTGSRAIWHRGAGRNMRPPRPSGGGHGWVCGALSHPSWC